MTPFKNRQLDHGSKTWCFRNLNRGGYSMVQKNLVVAHADATTLVDVTFVVRESGRQRVLSEGVKNVHAFVVGRVPEFILVDASTLPDWRRARYNPRRSEHFEAEINGEWVPVSGAKAATLDGQGMTVFAPQPL